MQNRLTVRSIDDVVCVDLSPEVDLQSADDVQRTLADIINGGCEKLIVNLQEGATLDSAGLVNFAGTMRLAKQKHARMVIVCADEHALQLFSATGLTRIFNVCNSMEFALWLVRQDEAQPPVGKPHPAMLSQWLARWETSA